MAMNLTDATLLYLLGGNRRKIYRQIVADTESGVSGLAPMRDVRATARELAELIKTAAGEDATAETAGELIHEMSSTYIAEADLDPLLAPEFGLEWDDANQQFVDAQGRVYESIFAKIQMEAEAISEQFTMTHVTSLQGTINEVNSMLQESIELFNGEIRRGFIDFNGERYFGIVIASQNVFSQVETSWTPEGETNEYYQIDTGDCFGLYTATGWQFWVGRQKLGWFDTSDGQLHVDSININSDFQLGNWRWINGNTSFGLKWVG